MIETRVPEKGFWQHYKHNPEKAWNDHLYEVLGITFHTETEGYLVRYRPLYSERAYLGIAEDGGRPLEMWFDEVEWDGKTQPRFVPVTNPELVEKLNHIRKELYGE